MPRPKIPPFSLVRGLIRQSWNKYNLYNLANKKLPQVNNKTMYQQKWTAKRETRAYHGGHLRERQFKALWSQKLAGVSPVTSATGVGSGAGGASGGRRSAYSLPNRSHAANGNLGANANDNQNLSTPLASQTYASVERRLDSVVFRALFASSAMQARQLCVHGKVYLNGHRCKVPSTLLNPGDLVEVEPAAVMQSVSAPVRMNVVEPAAAEEGAADAEAASARAAEDDGAAQAQEAAEAVGEGSKTAARRLAWEKIGQESFRPKPYASAFAFVPQYLEVSFETCACVYLRHPVARPGQTEVPSPFPTPMHALAYSFYQRNGR
ncbi:hypothetical protein PYCC9005_004360 [Savitreella phatthalungensis]